MHAETRFVSRVLLVVSGAETLWRLARDQEQQQTPALTRERLTGLALG
jgi:hypothetical protein